jgi:hypothetical protein
VFADLPASGPGPGRWTGACPAGVGRQPHQFVQEIRFHRSPTNQRQARPERSGRAWKAAASFARNDRSVRPQEIVTTEGGEAIPLATTTSVLLPAGVPDGRVNLVEDLVPGATDTEVQSLVRA